MKRTQKQTKKQILEALLSSSDVINRNAIAKKIKADHRTVSKYLPEIYNKTVEKINFYKKLEEK